MKLYTLSSPGTNTFSKCEEEHELSLLELSQSNDWDSNEFERISELRVGEDVCFGFLCVSRVK